MDEDILLLNLAAEPISVDEITEKVISYRKIAKLLNEYESMKGIDVLTMHSFIKSYLREEEEELR